MLSRTAPNTQETTMRFLLILILLSSCGYDDSNTYTALKPGYVEICGVYVYGTESFAVDDDMFCAVLDQTNALLRDHGYATDLRTLVAQKYLAVEFSTEPRPVFTSGRIVRGLYLNCYITIYPRGEENSFGLCMEMYCVFGHELLHFVAEEGLGGRFAGLDHDIPELFASSVDENDESVELDMYMYTYSMCGRVFGY